MKGLLGIILFVSILVLFSCSDNSTDPSGTSSEVTCKVRNGVVLDFKSDSTFIENIRTNDFTIRSLKVFMTVGTEKHILTLFINDYQNSKITYPVKAGSAQAFYEIDGKEEYMYDIDAEENSGVITLTTVSNDAWVGSFHFEAESKDKDKEIEVIEGKINVKK